MSITALFTKKTTATVLTAALTAGCANVPLGKKGGEILGGAVGAVLGEVAGKEIDDRRLRTVITGGATAAGVAVCGAIGSTQTICDGGDTTTSRDATRDNRTGEVTRDTSRQTRIENCDGGDYVAPPASGPQGNTPIFE